MSTKAVTGTRAITHRIHTPTISCVTPASVVGLLEGVVAGVGLAARVGVGVVAATTSVLGAWTVD